MNTKVKRLLCSLFTLVLVCFLVSVSSPAWAEEPEPRIHIEGCILLEDHDGECEVTPPVKTCVEGCTLAGTEHEECVVNTQCQINADCTLNNGHDGECQLPPPEHTCVEGCTLAGTEHEECVVNTQCKLNADCTLNNGHDGECQLPPPEHTCVEGCILEGEEHDECLIEAPCEADPNCTLNNGHPGECVPAAQVFASSGTWGGIDWTLDSDGVLVITPTAGTPVPDAKAPTKRTYEVGEWREAVIYNSSGVGKSIGGQPYDVNKVLALIIEEGVTSIGSFTAQFPNLTGEVIIPSTVTYIGQEAFHKTPITKLTFAEGGTEPLCIADGAFKRTQLEEIILPERTEHVHCWAFNNNSKLKVIKFPENITIMQGSNHIDYNTNFEAELNVSWANASELLSDCNKLETIYFGSEKVKNLFYSKSNPVGKDSVAAVGLAYCRSLEAACAIAKPGDTITLLKNSDQEITLPAGVILDKNGFTADNITEVPLPQLGGSSETPPPQTGDDSNGALYCVLMLSSLLLLAALLISQRKALLKK